MLKRKKSELLIDMEVLLYLLQDEWMQSRETTIEIAVSRSILTPCIDEVQNMRRYIDYLMTEHLAADSEGAEESPLVSMYATRSTCVLLRVAKKILEAAKERSDQHSLILKLDAEEYKLLKTRFGSHL